MIEEIFETGSEQVDDEDVMQPFLAEVVDVGNAGYMEEAQVRMA